MSKPPPSMKCDCCDEWAVIGVGSEQRCFEHAMEKANEEQARAGKPPLVAGDDGNLHPVQ